MVIRKEQYLLLALPSDQRNMNVTTACEHVWKCGNTAQGEVNSVNVSNNHVNVNAGLLTGCSSLNELTLPIYSDHATQVTGNFFKDLDLYFDLKGVSENLTLPLAATAVQDPFTKEWLGAEYYQLGTYEMRISGDKLHIRCGMTGNNQVFASKCFRIIISKGRKR
jgi:hypothetical protein